MSKMPVFLSEMIFYLINSIYFCILYHPTPILDTTPLCFLLTKIYIIKKTDASAGNTVNNSITPTLEVSASVNNTIIKPNINQ